MDCDQLPSLMMTDDTFGAEEEESEEMLQFLLHDASTLPKNDWDQQFESHPIFESCGVPPLYPTFDSDPHNPADPRSISAILSSPEQSPPSSPGSSSSSDSSGESSSPGGSSELYDAITFENTLMHFQGEETSFSTGNLLCQFSSPDQLSGFTIDPTSLHTEACAQPIELVAPKKESKPESRKRKRARKNKEEEEPAILTAVTIPRKQLLKLSSKELDDYAARLRATRPLTPAEEKDIRRQRRLIKNRESASLSRQRRKEHMDVLEVQVADLVAENDQLKAQVEYLSSENAALKDRLQQFESEKEPSPSFGERLRKMTKINSSSPFSSKSTAATAGACLAIVLFSFGLLFNGPLRADLANTGAFYAPQQPIVIEGIAPALPLEPEIATNIAKAARAENLGYDFPEWRIRKPLEIDELGTASSPIDLDSEEEIVPVRPVVVAKKSTIIPTFISTVPETEDVRMLFEHNSNGSEPEPTNDSSVRAAEPNTPIHTITIAQKEHKGTSSIHPSSLNSLPNTFHSSSSFPSSSPSRSQESNGTAPTNAGYLLCPQVQPLWSAEHSSKRITPDSLITLLVPADSMGLAADDPPKGLRTLIQVLCHVKEVRSVCVAQAGSDTPSVVPCSS